MFPKPFGNLHGKIVNWFPKLKFFSPGKKKHSHHNINDILNHEPKFLSVDQVSSKWLFVVCIDSYRVTEKLRE